MPNKETEKIIPEQEWEIIKFETRYNKPPIDGPYPKNIVKRRELLLSAQNFLAKYQVAQTKRCKQFFANLYKMTMEVYFVW